MHLFSHKRKAKDLFPLIPLNGFDDQERNLTFVKTDFQVLKLKFTACNFKLAFYPLHKLYIART